ncbi:MAG: glycoside hydrolase family 88 protein [Candidatus Jordarchaeaceae archaeon]
MGPAKNDIITYVIHKIELTSSRIGFKFPHITEGGCWKVTDEGSWTGGFWVGILWLAYILTKNEKFKKLAYKWMALLEPRKTDKMFDLGFLFYPSFVRGYKVTGDENLRKVALEAANTLAGLYNTKSGFICQEIKEGKFGRTAIDLIMDLPLLWWAYNESGEKNYYNVAYKHSVKSLKTLIKNDRPAIHAADIDLNTGKIVRKLTLHGYSYNSRWSRGQAWCIYGFTLAYNATKEKVFLSAAERLGGYFIKNLPVDHVPYWDLDDPNIPHAVKDTSAAGIACSGLLTLSKLSGKDKFEKVANKILNSLLTSYIADEGWSGILKGGCFDRPKNLGVGESLIWGDYYFLESLMKSIRVLQPLDF